jgi:hypothetical protein
VVFISLSSKRTGIILLSSTVFLPIHYPLINLPFGAVQFHLLSATMDKT